MKRMLAKRMLAKRILAKRMLAKRILAERMLAKRMLMCFVGLHTFVLTSCSKRFRRFYNSVRGC